MKGCTFQSKKSLVQDTKMKRLKKTPICFLFAEKSKNIKQKSYEDANFNNREILGRSYFNFSL